MIEYDQELRYVLFAVLAEIMRVPPEMKDLAVFCCVRHGVFDASYLKGFKGAKRATVRTQEPAPADIA